MGFDADKFVSGISEDKKCGVCSGVLDNPVRAACGHLYCSGCILPWVVRHGSCPQGCQTLTPSDLENVLPLREVILNLQVRCEYRPRGCQAVVRLTDLIAHIQDCSYRPVTCGHPNCGATVSQRQLAEHEGVTCEYRPVGICQEGCGLVLVHKTRHNHHCVTALRQLINEQEQHVGALEQELQRKDRSFQKRERVLLAQVTSLQRKVKQQAKRFHNQLTDLKHRFNNEQVRKLL
ncbi:hypothetical protein V1264_020872 [Littorina saxatilis]|uniref:Uncharacterized protein n=1 Tax=Littorina saxatilis TaxID=31220 RepID=A0AAN9BB03_9CAEN